MTEMRKWALQEAAKWVRTVRNDGVVEDTWEDAADRALAKSELGRIAYRLNKEAGIRSCLVCGCTDEAACDEGCSWAGPELCSACDIAARSLVRAFTEEASPPRKARRRR